MSSPHERFAACLARHPRTHWPAFPGRTNDLDAGVLVPVLGAEDPTCVLTERPRAMRRHAGEICFPGGRMEPGDVDLEATARREAHEEIGLSAVEILGRLSDIPLMTSDHRLHPFVAYADTTPDALVPSPDEVARLVCYPLRALYAAPSLHGIPWVHEGQTRLAPVFETGGRLLFGATAYVLYELLVALAPAFDTVAPPLVPGRYDWADTFTSS
jgi:8-oxo-dGTP pyrophosphatase MutT (NUDIX family)